MKTLKAYKVFPGESPSDFGCLLVFAENRNKARSIANYDWPGLDCEYIDFRAWRVKSFDKYACELKNARSFETNEELPDHWEQFFDDSEI